MKNLTTYTFFACLLVSAPSEREANAASLQGTTNATPKSANNEAGAPSASTSDASSAAFEVNVLWPFFPGGLSDFKLLLPTVARGSVVLGLFSDFGWRNARADDAGKVAALGAKVGYRQFFFDGIHLDATVNLGWRQERNNPFDGTTLDAFVGRLWVFAGYQYEISERFYINARGGGGLNLFRTDKFGHKEREFVPAGDINVGVRF